VELWNGRDLDGWRVSGPRESWSIGDGLLTCGGASSSLLYEGPQGRAGLRNFELEVEALAGPQSRAGVAFHAASAESGEDFEVCIGNSSQASRCGSAWSKTGSLQGIRPVFKQLVADGEWFNLRILVQGRNVQVRLNETLLVESVEPARLADSCLQDQGAIGLKWYGEDARLLFRSLRLRSLPDHPAAAQPAAAEDDVQRRIAQHNRAGLPMLDLHVHLKGGLTLEQALTKARRDGMCYGIAVNCGKGFPVQDDAAAAAFCESMKGQPAFVGMQAEGREWTSMFSLEAAARFDYIFTDAMTWTDDHGRRMRLWIPEEVGTIADVAGFMETLVARTVSILEHEPIDIFVNPAFLPAVIAHDYERLWTEARMEKVIGAAARNGVAIELNDLYNLPGGRFVRMAKAAGCKFTLGTNNTGPDDLRRSEHGLRMIDECALEAGDFFIPGTGGLKAALRKPEAFRKV
jgi:hypothetical protein